MDRQTGQQEDSLTYGQADSHTIGEPLTILSALFVTAKASGFPFATTKQAREISNLKAISPRRWEIE